MDHRPLVVGSASGVFSSLALGLIRDLASNREPTFDYLSNCLDCPQLEDPTVRTFIAGLLVGILPWPAIDLVQVFRARWRRFVLRQLGSSTSSAVQRPLFKVIA